MHDYVTVIDDHPAVAGDALSLPFLFMVRINAFDGGISQRIKHAVTGAGTQDEIVGKGYDVFQVYQDDVLSLFVFKGIYDFTSKFKCVQGSPHGLDNWTENNFV